MLIAGFPAGSFAANCYVVAAGPGEQCLIVDPGQDAEPGIEEIIQRHRLQPAAVLLTHGHIDHIWSVAPVCGATSPPTFIPRTGRCSAIRRVGSGRRQPRPGPRCCAALPSPSRTRWPGCTSGPRAGLRGMDSR